MKNISNLCSALLEKVNVLLKKKDVFVIPVQFMQKTTLIKHTIVLLLVVNNYLTDE